MNQDEDELSNLPITSADLQEKQITDSFILFNNYRDPFLGDDGKELASIGKANTTSPSYSNSSYSRPRNNSTPKVPKNQPVQTPPVNINTWPKIVYNGMITNSSKQQSMGFVSVDGVSNRVKIGDNIGELKVVDFNQNAITLSKGKEKKVFGK